jgi:phosphoglycerol transferase MdoB-like AlkP superfamily enzyme
MAAGLVWSSMRSTRLWLFASWRLRLIVATAVLCVLNSWSTGKIEKPLFFIAAESCPDPEKSSTK